MIAKILNGATALGACNKTEGITTTEQLAALFFSPQGREFCLKHNYPTLAMWREIKGHIPDLTKMGIFIDAGAIEVQGKGNIALIGETRAVAKFAGNNYAFHALVLHGAEADIRAENYAVFLVETDSTGKATITKDKTSIQL